MKKIIALLLACVMVLGLFAACAKAPAADNKTTTPTGTNDDPTTPTAPAEPVKITLTVWAPQEDQNEETPWLQTMCDNFAKAHPEYDITWEFGVCSEADAKGKILGDVQAAADVYMFANDQLEELVNANAIAKISGTILDQVKTDTSAGLLGTVTGADGNVYGVPYAGNTWWLYYDKSVFTDEDIKSLDAMLEKGKVAFRLNNGWYLPAFYYANGCTIFGANGTDSKAGYNMAGENGTAVTNYLVDLVANENFVADDGGNGLAGIRDGSIKAFVSGDWEAEAVKEALGENFGAAQLPCITINGEQKQMMAFAGTKAVGVNPYCEGDELIAAYMLAAYLGGAEGQKLRFEMRGSLPLANSLADLVKDNPVAQAQAAVLNNTSKAQPSLPGHFWSGCTALADEIIAGTINHDNAAQKTEEFNNTLNAG